MCPWCARRSETRRPSAPRAGGPPSDVLPQRRTARSRARRSASPVIVLGPTAGWSALSRPVWTKGPELVESDLSMTAAADRSGRQHRAVFLSRRRLRARGSREASHSAQRRGRGATGGQSPSALTEPTRASQSEPSRLELPFGQRGDAQAVHRALGDRRSEQRSSVTDQPTSSAPHPSMTRHLRR